MRKIFFLLPLLLAGCSAPRYYGYFGGQSYRFPVPAADQVARQTKEPVAEVQMASAADEETQLKYLATVASPVAVPQKMPVPVGRLRKGSQGSGTEPARFTTYSAPVFAGLDDDLKKAIILGAAGLTGLFLVVLSQVFGILGGLLLIGGVVFFTRWMLRQ